MAGQPFEHTLTDIGQLEQLYRSPSKGAVAKEIDHLDDAARSFIGASTFCLVATAARQGGADVSPKGGDPGFVQVLDEHRLVIPDLNGNNRLDSLRNIVDNPRAGLLFLVPEEGATLRVKGRAWVTTDPTILGSFAEYREPTTAIAVEVDSVYMHCAKCIRRAGLWDPGSWTRTADSPTGTDLLASALGLDDTQRAKLEANLESSYAEGLAADRPVTG